MKLDSLLSFLGVIVAAFATGFVFLCRGHYQWNTFSYTPDRHGEAFVQRSTYTRNERFIPLPDSKDGVSLHSWFFKPLNVEPNTEIPIVLIAHGLGSQKDMGLENYAAHFTSIGYAALVIDYRYFGGSTQTGNLQMRNYINPWFHIEDIKTAVRFIHNNGLQDSSIKTSSIALWGTSFAGGHMLKVAADLGPSMIKCVISQVPHLDGRAASKRGIAQRGVVGTIRLVLIAIMDYVSSEVFGFSPIYVKIVGTPEEVSYMILNPKEMNIYFAKHPKTYLGDWKNLAPARTLAVLSLYNPIEIVQHIRVPILFIGALDDPLCPIEFIRTAHGKAKNAKLVEVNSNHFGIYMGKPLEDALVEMANFLKTNLN